MSHFLWAWFAGSLLRGAVLAVLLLAFELIMKRKLLFSGARRLYTVLFLLILLPVGIIRMSPVETAYAPPVSEAAENMPPAPSMASAPSVVSAVPVIESSAPSVVSAVPVIEPAVPTMEEADGFSAADEPAANRSGFSASIAIFIIYAAIVLILAARQSWQLLIWHRRIHRCPMVADDRILAIFREAKQLTGFRRHVSLRDGSAILSTPASCGGLWNSVLLCPLPEVSRLSDSEVRMLLIHELGHFRSFDNPAGLLMAFGSDLQFFNPFLRFIASRAALVRELECDALVRLHMSAVPRWEATYARLLLKFQLKASGIPAPGLGVTAQCLKLRIEEIAVKSNKIKRVVPLVCIVGMSAAAAALASPCLLMAAPEADAAATIAPRDARSAFYPYIPTDARSVSFIEGNRSSAELFSRAGDFLKMSGINLPIEMLGHGVDICFIAMPGNTILLLRAPDDSPEFPESLRSYLPSGVEIKSLGSGLFVANPKNYDGLKKGADAQMAEQLEALPAEALAGVAARADGPETDGLFLTGWIVEKNGGPAQLRLKLAGIPETMRDRIVGNLAAMVENLKNTLGSACDKEQLDKAITVLSEAKSGVWELGVELTAEILHSVEAAATDQTRVAVDNYKRKLWYGGIYQTMRDGAMLDRLVKNPESLKELHAFADEQAGKLLSGNIPLDDPGFKAAFAVNRAETDENRRVTAIRLLMADCQILNRAFGTPEKTIELFEELSEKQPEIAGYAWYVVRDDVMDGTLDAGDAAGTDISEKQNKLCKLASKYYPDPLAAYLDFERNTLVYVKPGRSASNIDFHRDMLNRTANGLIAVARHQGKNEAAETINRRLKEFNRKADEFAAASNSNAPKVVSCFPANGAKNVDPGLTEITVTFDRGMSTSSWSFCQTDAEHFPESAGRPYFSDGGRTVTMPVRLKPDTEYIIYLNSGRFIGFISAADKVPLESYLYTFTTGSGSTASAGAEEAVGTTSAEPEAHGGRSMAEFNEYCDVIIGDMEERGRQEAADILADFDKETAGMKDVPGEETNDFLRNELKKIIWDSYTEAKWRSMRLKGELKEAYRENSVKLTDIQDEFEKKIMISYRFARNRAAGFGDSYATGIRERNERALRLAAEQEKRDAKRAREAAESEPGSAVELEASAKSGEAAQK